MLPPTPSVVPGEGRRRRVVGDRPREEGRRLLQQPAARARDGGLAAALAALDAAGPSRCEPLRRSGPVVVTEANAVIEGLHITSHGVGQPAVHCRGARGVTLRRLRVEHHPCAAAPNHTIAHLVIIPLLT